MIWPRPSNIPRNEFGVPVLPIGVKPTVSQVSGSVDVTAASILLPRTKFLIKLSVAAIP